MKSSVLIGSKFRTSENKLKNSCFQQGTRTIRRKIKELNETTPHIKIVREKQSPLLFPCSFLCNAFYISRAMAHQKEEKRKECSSSETEFSSERL